MSETLISTFGTVLVTSLLGWGVIGFMGFVTKNIDLKKQAKARTDKEDELTEAFKKS